MISSWGRRSPLPTRQLSMKTVAVLNFKGGVGKTTFTACVAQALAMAGQRILVIDNDYQHNLSSLLGVTPSKPNIRDVYLASIGIGGKTLAGAIQKSPIPGVEVVTSTTDLANGDVKDVQQLEKCIQFAKLETTFDHIFIDNSPGLDRLQEAALHACDGILAPTELAHSAISGVYEMHRMLAKKFQGESQIAKVVPYFYRGTKTQDSFRAALEKLLPGKVTSTAIPWDVAFEHSVEQRKILVLQHLSSNVVSHYLELIREVFGIDEKKVAAIMRQRVREEALQRLNRRTGDRKSVV